MICNYPTGLHVSAATSPCTCLVDSVNHDTAVVD